MVTRKYVKDYELSPSQGKKGRIKNESIYVGSYYIFSHNDLAQKMAKVLPAALLLGWILFVTAMIPQSKAVHSMYVILPYAFTAIPLGRLTGVALLLHQKKEPFIHSDSDKLSERYPASALWAMILTGAALIGELLNLIITPGEMIGGDIVFCLSAALLLAISILLFRRRADIRTQEKKK